MAQNAPTRPLAAALAVLACVLGPGEAEAQQARTPCSTDPATTQPPRSENATEQPTKTRGALGIDYVTPRYEPTVLPTIGGDTDIGAEIGAAGALTRFGNAQRPYLWRLNMRASVSFKADPSFTLVQQHYFAAFDAPCFEGTNVRLMPATAFIRTVDAPYFGRGNATNPTPPPGTSNAAQYNQYLAQTLFVRELTRIAVAYPYEVVVMPLLRYLAPRAYGGSRLAADVAANGADGNPLVRGFHDEAIATLAAGFIVDSRDNELFPLRGVYDQVGMRFVQGFPAASEVTYGGASGVFARYLPLGKETVVAVRGVADFEFGNVPFFDLYSGGPFRPLQLPGGSTGIRGVPLGLYSGLIKVVANVELRTIFVRFSVLHQKFRFGGDAFADAGRAFDDYSLRSSRNGSGLGVHWGTGAGIYFGWGDGELLRAEVAYSPDAFALHLPAGISLPIGVYVQDGVMF